MSEPRIGVYVCHCGTNIGGVVDCKGVSEYARTLPNVVIARDNKYTCSDPGQDEIKKDIKEFNLNRVVVASCSPRLHEPTFRKTVEDAGLNPYLFHMVNLREQCSWVHQNEKENATEKAKDLVRMGVAKATLLEELEAREVKVEPSTLVIGGGIAGIQASLDLAEMGFKVYLVEKLPSIGGKMAQLDKTFPTSDCSICILAPKMVDVARHENIELYTYSEVKEIKGYIGNFEVKILKKAKYVDEGRCVGCGVCAEKCPTKVPNEFDLGLGMRKAIYVPFPQAVPLKYTIDKENCIYFKTGKCQVCKKVCQTNAIDYEQKDKEINVKVGTIIVAIGFDNFDPKLKPHLGYEKYKNVITAMELERLINASGPTQGHVLRPFDQKPPKNIAFVQCVGSRDMKVDKEYCSRVCCMYTMKNAQLLKEHDSEVKITVYYMDIRAFGKGFEEFYHRIRKDYGVEYFRGRPAKVIEKENGNIVIEAEETLLNTISQREFDLVILSTGLVPPKGIEDIQRMLNISRSKDGFFQEAHPKLRPVDTSLDGVYLAGCCQSPKDIPDSVAQAKAASSSASIPMSKGKVKIEPLISVVDIEKCVGCGLCIELCPYSAPRYEIINGRQKVRIIEALCHGCGTCTAGCPQHAITSQQFTNKQIEEEIEKALEEEEV